MKRTTDVAFFMCKLHEEGKSIEEIAEATGYKASSVNVMLSRGGVSRARKIDPFMEWTEIIAWQPLPAPYQLKGE